MNRNRFPTIRMPAASAALACACGFGWTAPLACAQLHTSDIALKLEAGRLVTGRIEGGAPIFPHMVFVSQLGIYGPHGATFDPGFDSQTGALPPNSPVGITLRRALRRWDGSGFSVIPAERLDIIRSQTVTTPATDPANCGTGDSLELGLSTSTGRLHQHPAYQLHAPAPPGIYLVELEGWYGTPSQGVSEPFFVLFWHDEPLASVEDAAAWAETNLAQPCYANCDRSTTPPVLNVDDFTCFIDRFAQGHCYANCDGSTTAPVLNVDDFTCFINQFAQGCP